MPQQFQVLVLPAAQADLREAQAWYDTQARGLGQQFLNEVGLQMGRLADDPLRFSAVLDDIRRVRLNRFPYVLLYRVQGAVVAVMACFHARRNPVVWRARRP